MLTDAEKNTNTFFTQMHIFDKRKIKHVQCIIAERKGEGQRAIGLNGNLACWISLSRSKDDKSHIMIKQIKMNNLIK